MKNVIGNNLTLTLFGESHGKAIGGVLDGFPAGVRIDEELIEDMMSKRRAAGTISTGRQEADIPEFLSGIKNGVSEGTPIAFVIANKSQHSGDYNALAGIARPGHADYTGHVHYLGFEDIRMEIPDEDNLCHLHAYDILRAVSRYRHTARWHIL